MKTMIVVMMMDATTTFLILGVQGQGTAVDPFWVFDVEIVPVQGMN
jgi:hypothetical protein